MERFLHRLALAASTLIALASTASAGINSWTSIGPESGDIVDLVTPAATPSVTYALTPKQLYRSNDAGQTWTQVWLSGGHASDLAVHPTQTNRMFVLRNGDLFASADGGATEVQVMTPAARGSLRKIEFSADGTLLYVMDGDVLYRSVDFGATWQRGETINLDPVDSLKWFEVDPSDANRLIARTVAGTLLSTINAGNHWTVLSGPGTDYVSQIALSHSGTRIWVAAHGLWYTNDGGASWTASSLTGTVSAFAVHPTHPSIVYAQIGSSTYRSTDGGVQWTRSNGTSNVWTVNAFAFDPQIPERMMMATLNGVWASIDGGANWSPTSRGIVATTISNLSSTTNRTYFTVRGQVYALDPGATAPVQLDRSALEQVLLLDQFDYLYPLHADRAPTGDRLFANEGRYVARSSDGGQTWARLTDPLLGNDTAMYVLRVAPDNRNVILATTSKGILQSSDGGDHWNATSGVPETDFIFALDVAPAGIAYALDNESLYRTTNAGLAWSRVELPLAAAETLVSVVVSGDTAYLGTTAGGFKSTDGGVSWTRLPMTFGGYFTADITGLYMRTFGLSRSVDGGNTWSDIAIPLAMDPTDVQLDPSAPGRLFMGTQSGGVHTYTLATDLQVVSTSDPALAPAAGARTEISLTVMNRGPHAATGVRLNINIGGARTLFANTGCSVSATSTSATCTVAPIPVGQSKIVRIESSFETAGSLDVTASVAANEVELAATDNTLSRSWTYTPPTNTSGGGGGGALSWWMLLALAGVAVEVRRRACR